jgi:hypothetical protein
MAAEVIGYPNEDATYGEKATLRLLQANLPKEFRVFVEPPIHQKRENRYPDFVVLTNYGVIVLEVKDWVDIENVDSYGGTVLTRSNDRRHEFNPVTKAREYGIALFQNLRDNDPRRAYSKIPWGYAAVMYNLKPATLTQVRRPWGEEFVIGWGDLQTSNQLTKKLRETISTDHIHPLTKEEMDYARSVICPSALVQTPNRKPVILDETQTKLVVQPPPEPAKVIVVKKDQTVEMFPAEPTKPIPAAQLTPDQVADLFEKTSVRLVRGLAGSGKTLVLIQRAKFLADRHPEKKILVLSYNKTLASHLKGNFADYADNIRSTHFHSLCKDLLGPKWISPEDSEGWVELHHGDYAELVDLSVDFLKDEITWIKDTGVGSLEHYLRVERKGRGKEKRLTQDGRKAIYKLLEDYNHSLPGRNVVDFADIPNMVLDNIENGSIQPSLYDVILLDEAQDFAPSWIKVITKVLNPKEGVIFLADDPTQSIYKQYSWKEKGIPVVGRTVRLGIPYRNTFQIFKLANDLVKDDEVLKQKLREEDIDLNMELPADSMRQGERPLMMKANNIIEEADFIKRSINDMKAKLGLSAKQFVVLTRSKRKQERLKGHLKDVNITVSTFHAYKGMECEVVFLCGMEETFKDASDENSIAEEKKLVYMAMTRARQKLLMTYLGSLPKEIRAISDAYDQI